MGTLSKCPRFVICFDDGDRGRSETVYQSELPDALKRLCQVGQRINDVQPIPSEWDEEIQFQEHCRLVAEQDASGIERPF